jgi:hypothetical protein
MRRKTVVLMLTLAGAAGLFASAARAGCNDPRVATVRADINTKCTCEGNHGAYVSCVARAANKAVRDGLLDVNCKGAVTRCAARSTCGKKTGFVACAICEPGACNEGLCPDGQTACSDTVPCPLVVTHCSVKSSTDLCDAKGGIHSDGSCCDAGCVQQ